MYLSSSRARRAEASQGKVPVSSRICLSPSARWLSVCSPPPPPPPPQQQQQQQQEEEQQQEQQHWHQDQHNACNFLTVCKAPVECTMNETATTVWGATLRCKTPYVRRAILTAKRMKCPPKSVEKLWNEKNPQEIQQHIAAKKHETLFIVHGRSEHDIAWFEHDLSMKPLQSKNSCTGHEKCDSKFWHKTKRMKGCWYSADNPSMIRPRFENELINRNPPPCRANFSSFGDAFCAETCGISCSGYLAKKYFGARPPRWSS